jgi:hypothetical protein
VATPLPEVVKRLADAYRQAGYTVEAGEATQRMARLVVSDDDGACEVDVLKEAIGPPVVLTIGPVLGLEDAIGLKMRTLHDRAAHRDFLDIRAAAVRFSRPELERLGARHTPHFSLDELADRLGSIGERDTRRFRFYGLDADQIRSLLQWAQAWENDIRRRISDGDTGGSSSPAPKDWDAYLDRE